MPPQPGRRYQIRVRGQVGPALRQAFPTLESRRRGGDTVLSGRVPDQAALFGLLYSVEALGLELVEVRALRGGAHPRTPDNDV